MSRYVIVGAGAVGVTLAAELAQAGRDVVLAGRGRQLAAIRAGALRYLRPDGERTLAIATADGPDEVRLTGADVIVLATKAQHADEALARWAAQPVDGTGRTAGEVLPVLTLQNGLDAERAGLRRFGRVVGSVLWAASTYLADGVVSVPTAPAPGVLWLGTAPDGPPTGLVATIADDLRAAGFEVQVVDDLSRWKAGKLLSSVTFVLDGLYRQGPERDRAARLATDEARAILLAAGLAPADLRTESTVHLERFASVAIPGHERRGSSTWQSLARGRDVETDYLNGEIVLLARILGRRAPVNEALQARAQRAVREAAGPGALPVEDLLATLAPTVLVDAATLREELAGPRPPHLLDVRWALGDPQGEKHYQDGHLPGAVFVDLDAELAGPPSSVEGRHPLPAVADLQRSARGWGLRTGRPVVVYDDNGGLSAGRAWWLLRWAGLSDVRLLDGGLAAWTATGAPVEGGGYRPDPGDVELSGGQLPVLDADGAAALAVHSGLIDARAAERYRGEVEPIDVRAGHIPGAVNLPTGDNIAADGRFLGLAALRDRFATAGLTGGAEVGVSCGSGVTAAHEIAALALAGIDAALYPGSWSAWAAAPDRPVATGPDPSGRA